MEGEATQGKSVSVKYMNAFCRRYDLIFVESGRLMGDEVHWFIDADNEKRHYTSEEIHDKLHSRSL